MPRAASVCTEPGCPNLTTAGKCNRHRRQARQASDARRPTARARGYGRDWERTRREYLQLHPVCEDPVGCVAPSTDVDHIDGQGPLGPLGHDHSNLRALCHSHHSQRTARDQPGGWNQR